MTRMTQRARPKPSLESANLTRHWRTKGASLSLSLTRVYLSAAPGLCGNGPGASKNASSYNCFGVELFVAGPRSAVNASQSLGAATNGGSQAMHSSILRHRGRSENPPKQVYFCGSGSVDGSRPVRRVERNAGRRGWNHAHRKMSSATAEVRPYSGCAQSRGKGSGSTPDRCLHSDLFENEQIQNWAYKLMPGGNFKCQLSGGAICGGAE
jgi:hypothetical protein